jgi:hypothetical protein
MGSFISFSNIVYYYICNNYTFTAVNKLLLKYALLRNVLKKLAPHLVGLSSLYTFVGDQCKKKMALSYSS